MSAVEEILADLPIGQLASQLGVDEATAESAARQAIPALLGGLQANSEDPAGAASLAGALGDHSGDLLDGGVDLGQVDTGDGEKIVSNIFGPNSDQVAQTLGGALGGSQAGGQGDLMKRLLPILAPIVLAYLSKKVAGGKYGDLLGPLIGGAAGGTGGNVLTDILGKMLGRGGAAPNQPASAPDPEPTAEPAESARALDPRHPHRDARPRAPLTPAPTSFRSRCTHFPVAVPRKLPGYSDGFPRIRGKPTPPPARPGPVYAEPHG